MWTGVLVMALTAPSVEYGWQAGTDGQLEYIIELEDIAIAALRAGKEVSSDIHPDVVRSVRRFVARAERPQPARPTVAPRNDSQPAAQYGWKPGADGQLEYYIQLNSAALDAVERGQEISGNIHPEVAGKVKRLVLRLGDQPLPRISPPPERTPPPNRAEPSAPASTLPANPPPIDWGGWFTYGLNRELPGAAVPPGAVAHSYPQNTTDSRWSEPPSGGVSVPNGQPTRDLTVSSGQGSGLLQPPDSRFSQVPGVVGPSPAGPASGYAGTGAVLQPPPGAPALGNPAWSATPGPGIGSEVSSAVRQVAGATPPAANPWPAASQTAAQPTAPPNAAGAYVGNGAPTPTVNTPSPPAANPVAAWPTGPGNSPAAEANPNAAAPARPASATLHASRPEEPPPSGDGDAVPQRSSRSSSRNVWNEEPIARREDVPAQEQVSARAVWNVVNELLLFASLGINVVAIIIARQYYLRYCMLIKEVRRQPGEVVK